MLNAQWTQWYGNFGHQESLPGTTSYSYMQTSFYINQICVHYFFSLVRAIQVTWTNGSKSEYIGGTAGFYWKGCYTTNSGECFIGFDISYDRYINTLQFRTSDGQLAPLWGIHKHEEVSQRDTYNAGANQCISGINVRSLNSISIDLDQIQFYIITRPTPTANNSSPSPSNQPSIAPTQNPTNTPFQITTNNPSLIPSKPPTFPPSSSPSNIPSFGPLATPTFSPLLIQTLPPSTTPLSQPELGAAQFPSSIPSSATSKFVNVCT